VKREDTSDGIFLTSYYEYLDRVVLDLFRRVAVQRRLPARGRLSVCTSDGRSDDAAPVMRVTFSAFTQGGANRMAMVYKKAGWKILNVPVLNEKTTLWEWSMEKAD